MPSCDGGSGCAWHSLGGGTHGHDPLSDDHPDPTLRAPDPRDPLSGFVIRRRLDQFTACWLVQLSLTATASAKVEAVPGSASLAPAFAPALPTPLTSPTSLHGSYPAAYGQSILYV